MPRPPGRVVGRERRSSTRAIDARTSPWHAAAPGSGDEMAVIDGLGELGLALHGPGGPPQDVDHPVGRRVARRRPAGRLLLEVADPLDQGRGQQVVLRREVAVDGAEGDVGRRRRRRASARRRSRPSAPSSSAAREHPLAPGRLARGERRRVGPSARRTLRHGPGQLAERDVAVGRRVAGEGRAPARR